jgi:hypothetical protein
MYINNTLCFAAERLPIIESVLSELYAQIRALPGQ